MNIGLSCFHFKGIEKAPELAGGVGCEAIRIFTHSPSGGATRTISDDDRKEEFKDGVKKYAIKPFMSMRLITSIWLPKITKFITGSISAIRKNLERASFLEAKYVMTHLGSSGYLAEKGNARPARKKASPKF